MARGAAPFRVLVVDDEPVYRALVPSMIEAAGVEVRCVPDGSRAVAEARAWRPDLVLLDLVMPGLDGWTVLRLLRADPGLRATAVHLLTSRQKAREGAAAEQAGADGFIQKPFRGQELVDLVAALRTSRN